MKIKIYRPSEGKSKELRSSPRGWAETVNVGDVSPAAYRMIKAMEGDLSATRSDEGAPRLVARTKIPSIQEAAEALGYPEEVAAAWESRYGPLGGEFEWEPGDRLIRNLWGAYQAGRLEEELDRIASTPGLAAWVPATGERRVITEGHTHAPPKIWGHMLRQSERGFLSMVE